MGADGIKGDLQKYLQVGRDAMLWKLEGLSNYDVRRPMVPTGSNLLGLVKHLALVEIGYFGDTFGRPFPTALPPWEEMGPNADLYATAEESRDDIIDLYRQSWVHADETIDALHLDATGRVPWWSAGHDEVTLHRILIHVIAETHRHAGHADLIRELIDGSVGWSQGNENTPDFNEASWRDYRQRLEDIARSAG